MHGELNTDEKRFILERFFDVNWNNMIRKFPRYSQLLAKRGDGSPESVKNLGPLLVETQPSGTEEHAVVGVPEGAGGYLTVLFEYFGKVVTITEPGLLRDFVDGKTRAM